MKKAYELTILNQQFTLKSDADEKHVKKVADYVNKKMHEIVSGSKAISTANVAILTALNIADDYFRTKAQNNEQITQWVEKVQGLLEKIDGIKSLPGA